MDKNGAEYHGDLTKSVTHLIAATPSGKKYEHALSWRMKIVSIEWFEHSLERGMVLDEALYNPTLPVDERGKGAWDRRHAASPSLGKRTRDADQGHALNPFRRKLRRSASTKMGSQSEALWAGITAASLDRQQDEEDEWTEDNIAGKNETRTSTPSSLTKDAPTSIHSPALVPVSAVSHEGLFQGRIVCPHGFDIDKVRWLHGRTRAHLTCTLDKHPAPALGQSWSACSVRQ